MQWLSCSSSLNGLLALQILRKGDLQVNNLERTQQLSSLTREICTLVSEMTVDPSTSRTHTVGMVEKAMSEVNFNVRSDRPAKVNLNFLLHLLLCSIPSC